MAVDVLIKDKIKEYIPDWIRDKHPLFLEFFEAYYEWLELQGNAVDIIRNFREYTDLDTSIDSFIDYFKNDIIPDLPESALADKRLYLKHIDDLYKAKGTIQSFKLLFRILYNQPIEVIFPRDNILRLSGSTWIDERKSIKTTSTYGVGEFKGRSIEARNYITDISYTVTGTADVQDVIRYNQGLYIVTEMFLSNVSGFFNANDSVHFNDSVESIIPSIVGVDITNGGTTYKINREVQFDKTTQFIKTFTFTTSNDFDMGVTSVYLNTDIEVRVNGSLVADNDILFDGRVVTVFLTLINGDSLEIKMPNSGLYAFTNNVDNLTGELKSIAIANFGIAYNSSPAIDLTTEGDGTAIASFQLGGLITYGGRYSDDKSKLSNASYLYDGNYYQEYSYVIKSSISIDKFGSIFKQLVHPSGFNLFSIIQIVARESDDIVGFDFSRLAYDITEMAYSIYESELTQLGATTIQMELEKLNLGFEHPISHYFDIPINKTNNHVYTPIRPGVNVYAYIP